MAGGGQDFVPERRDWILPISAFVRSFNLQRMPPNNSMQLTASRAAADTWGSAPQSQAAVAVMHESEALLRHLGVPVIHQHQRR